MATERNTRNAGRNNKNTYENKQDQIDYPEWFWRQGLRVADLLILVEKGKTEEAAKQVFRKHRHVISTSWRVNAIANLFAEIYYTDSNMLNETIETIRAVDNISKVEFSEIVKVVDRRNQDEIQKDIEAL